MYIVLSVDIFLDSGIALLGGIKTKKCIEIMCDKSFFYPHVKTWGSSDKNVKLVVGTSWNICQIPDKL